MAIKDPQHLGGRVTAFIYLLLGLALLLYVFWQGHRMLTHPVPGLVLPHAASAAAATPPVDFGRMGVAALSFLLRLAVLLVMTIVASLITARGVHLYHVASTPATRSTEPEAAPAPSLSIAKGSADDPPPASSKEGGRQ